MPRALKFLLGENEIALEMNKIDRTRLYGSKEIEVLDENDSRCELATLADDGRTMIGRGGTGMGWLDADGRWCDKTDLKPYNVDGDLVEPVPSSFSAPIKLFDTATADDYLSHNIRLVYRLTPAMNDSAKEQNLPPDPDANATRDGENELNDELARGTIFKFAYSYRGGLEADVAFLLHNDLGELMMVVGNPSQTAFVGMQAQLLEPDSEESTEVDDPDNLMSFDMI